MERRETSVRTGMRGAAAAQAAGWRPVRWSFQCKGKGERESGERRKKGAGCEGGSLPAPAPSAPPPTTRSVARVTHPVPRPAAASPASPASPFRPTSPPHHWRVGPRVLGGRAPSPRPQCASASGAGHDCPGLATAQRGASGASRRLHGRAVHGSSTGAGPGPVCLTAAGRPPLWTRSPGASARPPNLGTSAIFSPRAPSSARSLARSDCSAGGSVRFLGQEDPLAKEMATQSSILVWKIPWTEEAGRLQSMSRRS